MTRIGNGLAALVAIAMSAACSSSDGDAPATGDSAVVDSAIDDAPKSDTTPSETSLDSAATDSLATDSAATDSAKTETATDGGSCGVAAPTCNTLTMPSSATLVTGTVGAIPTFTAAGDIPDGLYVLTREVIESGTPKPTKEVISIAGNCLLALVIAADGTETRVNGTSSFVSGAATFTFTCPTPFTQHPSYGRADAGGGKVKLLTLSDPSLGTKTYREWVQQ